MLKVLALFIATIIIQESFGEAPRKPPVVSASREKREAVLRLGLGDYQRLSETRIKFRSVYSLYEYLLLCSEEAVIEKWPTAARQGCAILTPAQYSALHTFADTFLKKKPDDRFKNETNQVARDNYQSFIVNRDKEVLRLQKISPALDLIEIDKSAGPDLREILEGKQGMQVAWYLDLVLLQMLNFSPSESGAKIERLSSAAFSLEGVFALLRWGIFKKLGLPRELYLDLLMMVYQNSDGCNVAQQPLSAKVYVWLHQQYAIAAQTSFPYLAKKYHVEDMPFPTPPQMGAKDFDIRDIDRALDLAAFGRLGSWSAASHENYDCFLKSVENIFDEYELQIPKHLLLQPR